MDNQATDIYKIKDASGAEVVIKTRTIYNEYGMPKADVVDYVDDPFGNRTTFSYDEAQSHQPVVGKTF